MEKYFKNKRSAIVISLFSMMLWGSAIPLIKATYREMEVAPDDAGAKVLVAGARFCIAGLMGLVYFLLLHREKKTPVHISWKYVGILCLFQTSFQYSFYYLGLSRTLGVKAAVIQSCNAFFIVILSALMMKDDRLTPRRLLSLLIGTAGIVVTNFQAGTSLHFRFTGEGFILIAALFGALATVFVRKYGKHQDPALASGLQFFLGSLPLIVLGAALCHEWPKVTPAAVLMLLYGGFISATAFMLWSMVLRYQNSGEFGVYRLFIPVFGSLFSVLFLKERFTASIFAGMVLVLLGSLILNLPARKKRGEK